MNSKLNLPQEEKQAVYAAEANCETCNAIGEFVSHLDLIVKN